MCLLSDVLVALVRLENVFLGKDLREMLLTQLEGDQIAQGHELVRRIFSCNEHRLTKRSSTDLTGDVSNLRIESQIVQNRGEQFSPVALPLVRRQNQHLATNGKRGVEEKSDESNLILGLILSG